MTRTLRLTAFALALGAAAVAAPVSASAALSDCRADRMCLWGNNDFVFMIGDRSHGDSTIVNLLGDGNNEMDSWANRSATYSGCMFGGTAGSGDRQTLARNSNDNNVGFANSDEVSSWRTRNAC